MILFSIAQPHWLRDQRNFPQSELHRPLRQGLPLLASADVGGDATFQEVNLLLQLNPILTDTNRSVFIFYTIKNTFSGLQRLSPRDLPCLVIDWHIPLLYEKNVFPCLSQDFGLNHCWGSFSVVHILPWAKYSTYTVAINHFCIKPVFVLLCPLSPLGWASHVQPIEGVFPLVFFGPGMPFRRWLNSASLTLSPPIPFYWTSHAFPISEVSYPQAPLRIMKQGCHIVR